ncbi:hypothetical protein ACFJIX_14345 [Roseateles sp. UC29_93]|uniref:hypothetical protein n=1 Tax=Roseateles sp. UC29_93 TaxID=3350177 RepID=UPI003671ED2B
MNVDVDFEADGFALIESVMDPEALKALAPVVLREGAVGGSRCLLARPQIAALAATLRGQGSHLYLWLGYEVESPTCR